MVSNFRHARFGFSLAGSGLAGAVALGFAFGPALADIPIPQPKPWIVETEPRPEPTFFKIATGSPGGTYFPIGSALAAIISHPFNSERCAEDEKLCGPLGMQAVAQNSDGSVRNILAVNDGDVASGLAQADFVAAARDGTGPFAIPGKQKRVRAIANLYLESMHVVVAATLDVESVADLRGHCVSIGPKGSGTHDNALKVLAAFGLGKGTVKLSDTDALEAADQIMAGELDAFFFIGGAPVPLVTQLIDLDAARLLPIAGSEAGVLAEPSPVLQPMILPADVYGTPADVPVLGINALWIVSEEVSEERVYRITQAFWQKGNRQILLSSHPIAATIAIENATAGIPVPLHAGAERFYREAGVLPAEEPAGDDTGSSNQSETSRPNRFDAG